MTFCGHGKDVYGEDIKNKLKEEVENLIKQGADLFYLGGYGKFDGLAAEVLTELKEKYHNIREFWLFATLTEIIIPEITMKHFIRHLKMCLLSFAFQKEMNGW